ncbi:MAG: hypothetical protein MJ214_00790 [Bacilli bacterium]|nr:hypothetical protein [Bacilli bacterium]
MNKIKILMPLALCAVTLASCDKATGNNVKDITLLDRVSYKAADTFYDLAKTFEEMHEAQFPEEEQTNAELPFQLSKQGTATVQYCIKISGTVKIDYISDSGLVEPINFNNWNIAAGNKITASWDLEQDSPYLKIANEQESYYLGIEHNADDEYYRYYNSEVKGEKYKTKAWFDYDKDYFSNVILDETASNFCAPFNFYIRDMLKSATTAYKNKRYIGFDLSGFGVDAPDFFNILSIGSALEISSVARGIDSFLALNPIEELTAKCASDDEKTAAVELKLDETNIEEYSSLLELYTGLRAAGKMSFDYFAAFADSRIKQQEILLDIKNASLLGAFIPQFIFGANQKAIDGAYVVDASNINITLHANEEVTDKCETVDTYNPADYKLG